MPRTGKVYDVVIDNATGHVKCKVTGRGMPFCTSSAPLSVVGVWPPVLTPTSEALPPSFRTDNVSSAWTPLDAAAQETVARTISSDLMALGDVLNGSLPISLLQQLEAQGVHLLPTSCRELGGSCTCPDFNGTGDYHYGATTLGSGQICKHIAG